MSFLKDIFDKKEESMNSYRDFWTWFQKNEKTFFDTVKRQDEINKDFFDHLSPKLDKLKDGFFFLTGMYNDNIAELVLTPDGNVKNIVFVEELVKVAPSLSNWKFTALKPASDIKDVNIKMADLVFDKDSLFFYSNDHRDFPDEIDITIIHRDFDEENKSTLINGTYIFLDNYLGELNSITTIDSLTVIGKDEAEKELIPIDKLKDFLIWRQKEFIEKYEGDRHNTENDSYSNLEAELTNGGILLATVNSTLLEWDRKASHPWILSVEIKYNGEGNNGMPDDKTYQILNEIEDEILEKLKDYDGYLNIGRQTTDGLREIYFACKDFRKPSKVLYQLTSKYLEKQSITYDIYKDKYWRSFNRFRDN